MSAVLPTARHGAAPSSAAVRRPGVGAVVSAEARKLAAQWRSRVTVAVCLLGPFAFVGLVHVSGTLPADTVFGGQVESSAPATALVALGFAGSWAIPLIVALVAGDVVSAEDHFDTWPTLLTRSVSRRALLVGKIVVAASYAVLVLVLLAIASLAAGFAVGADRPLIGLSGNLIGVGTATGSALAAWASVLPAALAYAGLAVMISTITRNSLAGVVVPVLVGLVGQLLTLVDGAAGVAAALPSGSFLAWHGLFGAPGWTGPLVLGVVVSVVWAAAAILVAVGVFRRRLRGQP